MKTGYDKFISYFQLISISYLGQFMKTAYKLYKKNIAFILSCFIEIAYP
jgi:hypothetical protein